MSPTLHEHPPTAVASPRIAVYRSSAAGRIFTVARGLAAIALLGLGGLLVADGTWALRASLFTFWSAILLTPVVAFIGMMFDHVASERRGSIELARDAVTVVTASSRWSLPAASLRAGLMLRRPDGRRVVELTQSLGDRIEVEVETPHDGHEILGALGFSSGRRATEVRSVGAQTLARHTLAGLLIGSFFGTALSLGLNLPPMVTVALLAVGLVAQWRLLGARKVLLGSDGVTLSWGSQRFVAWRDIAAVERRAGDVWLRLHVGRPLSLKQWIDDAAHREAVGAHIESAMRPARALSPERLHALEQHGRAVEQWRSELAALASPAGYRAAGFSPDELQAVLDSPETTQEQKLGAAIALASRGEEAHKTYIRAVSEAVVHAPMREALARIADGAGDEFALGDALEEIERTRANR